jgi:hypothetical protein
LPELSKIALDVVADRSDEREGCLTLKRYEIVVVDDATAARDRAPEEEASATRSDRSTLIRQSGDYSGSRKQGLSSPISQRRVAGSGCPRIGGVRSNDAGAGSARGLERELALDHVPRKGSRSDQPPDLGRRSGLELRVADADFTAGERSGESLSIG